jgi:hypothetical protein
VRFTPSPVHTDAEIAALIAALKKPCATCPAGEADTSTLGSTRFGLAN